jgi:hypothetical protein
MLATIHPARPPSSTAVQLAVPKQLALAQSRNEAIRKTQLRCIDQRIIEAEQLLSRLIALAEDRHAWGLDASGSDALRTRIAGRLADWQKYRAELF